MSSVRVKHDKENPYVILNKKALQSPDISWEAKGLWSYLLSLPDDWVVSVAHLSTIHKGRGGGRDAIWSIMKELIQHGYACRIEIREKGKIKGYDYEVYEKPIKLKKSLPHTALPCTVNPTQQNTYSTEYKSSSKSCSNNLYKKAMPTAPQKPKAVKAMVAVPSSIEEKKQAAPRKSKERLYPRPPLQEESFQYLKTLNLDTHENTLSFWAYKYPLKRLKDIHAHMKFKMKEGGMQPKSKGALFRSLLENEHNPINDYCLENKDVAIRCKKKYSWSSLKIGERYVTDEDRPDYDLSYQMPKDDFLEGLKKMYQHKNIPTYPEPQNTYCESYEDYED